MVRFPARRAALSLAARVALALALPGAALAQPRPPGYAADAPYARELRGVWLTNVDSDVLSSREAIAEAMTYLASRGFNVVYPVVYNKGYTLHPSQVMAEAIGPAYRQDPAFAGRDPLAEVVVEAHRVGMEVVPWFEFGFASSYSLGGGHIVAARPSWAALNSSGQLVVKNGFDWLNALDPEVQDWMRRLVVEVARTYDVDGIQGDDRLPAMPSEGGYNESVQQAYAAEHGGVRPPLATKDPEWLRWRAARLTRWLGTLRRDVKAVTPHLAVSLSPSHYPFGYEEYLQNTPAWADSSYGDTFHPQMYRYEVEGYRDLVRQTVGTGPGTGGYLGAHRDRVFPGVLLKAGTKLNGPAYALDAVRSNREAGLRGEVFFFYEGLRSRNAFVADTLRKYVYTQPALVPYRDAAALWRPQATLVHETDAGVRTGAWAEACVDPRYPVTCVKDGADGTTLQRAATGSASTATYALHVPTSGVYDVFVYVPARSLNRPSAATAASYTLEVQGTRTAVTIDQNGAGTQGRFVQIATVNAVAGSPMVVRLDAAASTGGAWVFADAVMAILNRKQSPGAVVTGRETSPAPRGAARLRLAPNPAAHRTVAHLDGAPAGEPVRLRVADVAGRVVFAAESPSPEVTIPTDGWATGVYVVEATAGAERATAPLVVL